MRIECKFGVDSSSDTEQSCLWEGSSFSKLFVEPAAEGHGIST